MLGEESDRSRDEVTPTGNRKIPQQPSQPLPRNYGLRKRMRLTNVETGKLLLAFWIFGLCNNIGYVVMLTAAQDLVTEFSNQTGHEYIVKEFKRECTVIGTGAILLANIVPSILVKFIAPFLPLIIHVRFVLIVLMTMLGFVLAALGYGHKHGYWSMIIGVISISFSNGLGESSLLAYTAFFSTSNVVSTWSSGTGAAGVVGALLYSALREAKISPQHSLLSMLIWPTLMATAFWGLVKHPYISRAKVRHSQLEETTQEQIKEDIPTTEDVHTFLAKLKILQKIVHIYTTPFGLVYFFEYFINQALFELMYFPDDLFTQESQYRWYQTIYQVGVFISRSSMNIIEVNNLWMLVFLQAINAVILLLEVIFGFLYFVLVCLACIFWEGIVAGTSYVNTYRKITAEVPPLQREFSMTINSIGDAIMITMAGSIAIPVHTMLCKVENPYEKRRMIGGLIHTN